MTLIGFGYVCLLVYDGYGFDKELNHELSRY
jgi:hypothetical protein